jgi:hypothetical protein
LRMGAAGKTDDSGFQPRGPTCSSVTETYTSI